MLNQGRSLVTLPVLTDITYESLAKAFGQELEYHEETLYRMTETNKTRAWVSLQNKEQVSAQHRMALFPNKAEVLFASPDIWIVSHVCFLAPQISDTTEIK